MLFYALLVTLSIAVWLVLAILVNSRQRHARDVPDMKAPWPSVSIIVPAHDEEEMIEKAMRSLLALDYPDFEILAVDDRSTDGTGRILDRLAGQFPERLRAIHIKTLPAGWLGKCNALDVAARQARGEWILFTDADVVFEPPAIRTAIAFATANGADHIGLYPRMIWEGYLEASILALFVQSLAIAFRTWDVESPSLKSYVGLGAFNMIKRSLYDRIGGHAPLRLEVADDMKLAYLAKKHGGKSMTVNSDGQVRVRWRQGALDIVRGIERSGFAGINFRWGQLLLAILFFGGILLAPYFLPFIDHSKAVTALSILSIILLLSMYYVVGRMNGLPKWAGILHPVSCLLYIYALLRSAIVTTARGGLEWRGTFYSISELKSGTVR